MLKSVATVLICAALMFAAPAFAVDGVVLINQSTVMNSGGGFPYKITQPGSYKLSGNLVVPANANVDGIDIQTDHVTIDLNGFTISGPVTCTGSGISISCGQGQGTGIDAGSNDITIRNGSIAGFVIGAHFRGVNNLVEEIHASGNSLYGLIVSNGVVRRNTTALNGIYGIVAHASTVIENASTFNGAYGLSANQYVIYGSNAFDFNGVHGVSGGLSQNNNVCDGTTC